MARINLLGDRLLLLLICNSGDDWIRLDTLIFFGEKLATKKTIFRIGNAVVDNEQAWEAKTPGIVLVCPFQPVGVS